MIKPIPVSTIERVSRSSILVQKENKLEVKKRVWG